MNQRLRRRAMLVSMLFGACSGNAGGGGGGGDVVWNPDGWGDGAQVDVASGDAAQAADGANTGPGSGGDAAIAGDVALADSGVVDSGGGGVVDSGGGGVVDSGGGGKVCAPGATQLCLCSPKVEGVQICAANGTTWGPCDCAPVGTTDGGSDTGTKDTGGVDAGGSDTGDPWNSNCLERAKHIYVLTQGKMMIRFETDKMKLMPVGKLNCPFPGGSTPFSMAVDRNAVAWILDQPVMGGGGSLYKASTLDASCAKTYFQPNQAGMQLFGMGFSSNGPGSQEETLFVAGGDASNFTSIYGGLASISFPTLKLSLLAKLQSGPGSPELTGNGAGQLFGFYPSTSPPSVRQIIKTSGATGKVWPLPGNVLSNVQAWAFAQWGGDFYLFFKSVSQSASAVHRLDGKSGKVVTVIPNTGNIIVGAGVSSCAPTKID